MCRLVYGGVGRSCLDRREGFADGAGAAGTRRAWPRRSEVRGVPHGVGPAGAHRWIAVFDSQGVEGIVLLAGTGGGYQTRIEYVVAAGREDVGRRCGEGGC